MPDTGTSATVATDRYSDQCRIRVQVSGRTHDRPHGRGFIHSDVQTDKGLSPTEVGVGDQGLRVLIDNYGDRFDLWQRAKHLDWHEGTVLRLHGCLEADRRALNGVGAPVQRGQHVAYGLSGKSRLRPASGKRMHGPEPGATGDGCTGDECTLKKSSAFGV